jgi:hypothetical protein
LTTWRTSWAATTVSTTRPKVRPRAVRVYTRLSRHPRQQVSIPPQKKNQPKGICREDSARKTRLLLPSSLRWDPPSSCLGLFFTPRVGGACVFPPQRNPPPSPLPPLSHFFIFASTSSSSIYVYVYYVSHCSSPPPPPPLLPEPAPRPKTSNSMYARAQERMLQLRDMAGGWHFPSAPKHQLTTPRMVRVTIRVTPGSGSTLARRMVTRRQLTTAGMVHVTNLTPGSECSPTAWRAARRRPSPTPPPRPRPGTPPPR